MKKKLLFTIAAAVLTLGASAQQWESLFNGKNLSGWKQLNGKAEYKVIDGEIVGISKTGTPNSFLTTKNSYGDFIFEFEFKVDNGLNSGVQFRSLSTKDFNDGRVRGYQFEIDPSDRAWTGGIYDEAQRGWLYRMTSNPAAQSAFKNNAWNKARIEAIGNRIRTWVNGIECSNLIDNASAEGFIALQVHQVDAANDGKTVCWRNLRICTEDVNKYATADNHKAPEVNCIANTLTDYEKQQGWALLWDGETTNGWKSATRPDFPKKGWAIQDGILKVLPADGGESTNGGDIITTKTYKNFILKVDFKITDGANSGVKYFVDPNLNKGTGSAIGCEFQILDDERHPDAKAGVNGNRTMASLYDLIPSKKGVWQSYTIDGFSTAMIVVEGNHVEHWLNGEKVLEYERGTQMWDAFVDYSKYRDWPNFGNFEEGFILLQDHGNEVWFKNVKIKVLD